MIMLIRKHLITLKLRFSVHKLLLPIKLIITVTRQKNKYLTEYI